MAFEELAFICLCLVMFSRFSLFSWPFLMENSLESLVFCLAFILRCLAHVVRMGLAPRLGTGQQSEKQIFLFCFHTNLNLFNI